VSTYTDRVADFLATHQADVCYRYMCPFGPVSGDLDERANIYAQIVSWAPFTDFAVTEEDSSDQVPCLNAWMCALSELLTSSNALATSDLTLTTLCDPALDFTTVATRMSQDLANIQAPNCAVFDNLDLATFTQKLASYLAHLKSTQQFCVIPQLPEFRMDQDILGMFTNEDLLGYVLSDVYSAPAKTCYEEIATAAAGIGASRPVQDLCGESPVLPSGDVLATLSVPFANLGSLPSCNGLGSNVITETVAKLVDFLDVKHDDICYRYMCPFGPVSEPIDERANLYDQLVNASPFTDFASTQSDSSEEEQCLGAWMCALSEAVDTNAFTASSLSLTTLCDLSQDAAAISSLLELEVTGLTVQVPNCATFASLDRKTFLDSLAEYLVSLRTDGQICAVPQLPEFLMEDDILEIFLNPDMVANLVADVYDAQQKTCHEDAAAAAALLGSSHTVNDLCGTRPVLPQTDVATSLATDLELMQMPSSCAVVPSIDIAAFTDKVAAFLNDNHTDVCTNYVASLDIATPFAAALLTLLLRLL
jgi:hypothetical protein